MKALLRFFHFAFAILAFCGCQSDRPRGPSSPAILGTPPTAATLQMTPSGGAYNIPDPLVSLNKLFLEGYKQRLGVVSSNTRPLIVASFSSLILYWNDTVETNRAIPDIYHALKTVAHVPFGIFLRVHPYANEVGDVVPDAILADLNKYQERIGEAEASLADAGYSPVQLARQRGILATCRDYIRTVIDSGKAKREELLAFAHKAGPFMLADANEAAAAQLDTTHEVVMRWKKKIAPEAWKRLVVVIPGPQMPRRLNVFTQYFAKVLGEHGHNLGYPLESRRLIYAESPSRGRDHLDLMATTFIDGDASEAFFGDRWRMSRDVLADGAKEHLKRLKFD